MLYQNKPTLHTSHTQLFVYFHHKLGQVCMSVCVWREEEEGEILGSHVRVQASLQLKLHCMWLKSLVNEFLLLTYRVYDLIQQ